MINNVTGKQTKATVLNTAPAIHNFIILWTGQLISTVGSGMSAFALGVYVYQKTHSVTEFALIFLAGMLPRVLFSPFAGVLADRFNRRMLMVLSDLGAMSGIGLAYILSTSSQLVVWQIYLVTATVSTFSALRVPTYTATAGLLVSKEQKGRVGGMIQLSDGMGQVIAPLVAAALLSRFALPSVLRADLLSYGMSLASLLIVRFPSASSPSTGKSSIFEDLRTGWNYLITQKGLLGLLVVFAIGNFFVGNAEALLTPMILGLTSTAMLGTIMSASGVGMIVGGVLLSVWGGGKNRIYTILGAYALMGLGILLAGLLPSVLVVGLGICLAYLSLPFVIGATSAILISKVAPELQGRILALRISLALLTFTLAFVTAGPLADHIFDPLLAPGGLLVPYLGSLIGIGASRGIGLMFVIIGGMAILTALGGFLYPRLRKVEHELPDIE